MISRRDRDSLRTEKRYMSAEEAQAGAVQLSAGKRGYEACKRSRAARWRRRLRPVCLDQGGKDERAGRCCSLRPSSPGRPVALIRPSLGPNVNTSVPSGCRSPRLSFTSLRRLLSRRKGKGDGATRFLIGNCEFVGRPSRTDATCGPSGRPARRNR